MTALGQNTLGQLPEQPYHVVFGLKIGKLLFRSKRELFKDKNLCISRALEEGFRILQEEGGNASGILVETSGSMDLK